MGRIALLPRLIVAFAVLILAGNLSDTSPVSAGSKWIMVMSGSEGILRSESTSAGRKSTLISTLGEGTWVEVLDSVESTDPHTADKPIWYKVKTEDQIEGWIWSDKLDLDTWTDTPPKETVWDKTKGEGDETPTLEEETVVDTGELSEVSEKGDEDEEKKGTPSSSPVRETRAFPSGLVTFFLFLCFLIPVVLLLVTMRRIRLIESAQSMRLAEFGEEIRKLRRARSQGDVASKLLQQDQYLRGIRGEVRQVLDGLHRIRGALQDLSTRVVDVSTGFQKPPAEEPTSHKSAPTKEKEQVADTSETEEAGSGVLEDFEKMVSRHFSEQEKTSQLIDIEEEKEKEVLRLYNGNRNEFKRNYQPSVVTITNPDEVEQGGAVSSKEKPRFKKKVNGLFLVVEEADTYYLLPRYPSAADAQRSQIEACFDLVPEGGQVQAGFSIERVERSAICIAGEDGWILKRKGLLSIGEARG